MRPTLATTESRDAEAPISVAQRGRAHRHRANPRATRARPWESAPADDCDALAQPESNPDARTVRARRRRAAPGACASLALGVLEVDAVGVRKSVADLEPRTARGRATGRTWSDGDVNGECDVPGKVYTETRDVARGVYKDDAPALTNDALKPACERGRS